MAVAFEIDIGDVSNKTVIVERKNIRIYGTKEEDEEMKKNSSAGAKTLLERLKSHLTCPITQEVFQEPVVAEDGQTYEKGAIVNWLQQNLTSPLTRQTMITRTLAPNYVVRSLIKEFIDQDS